MRVIIATWRMALDGAYKGREILLNKGLALDAVEEVIKDVENNELFLSVGYGGLPNNEGEVELDAGIMDGTTFQFGAVAGMKNFPNPISVARSLMSKPYNNFLVGEGAELYAETKGFKKKDLLTITAKEKYLEKKPALLKEPGHDTIGVVALDVFGNIVAGTSTSGLFMKNPGRVGDSPIIGSGFYADSDIGGASVTGVGEDIIRGVISYEIVRLIESGFSAQTAAEEAVDKFSSKLRKKSGQVRDISVVCIDKEGRWGAATNGSHFSFVVVEDDNEPVVYLASNHNGKTIIKRASQEWIKSHIE